MSITDAELLTARLRNDDGPPFDGSRSELFSRGIGLDVVALGALIDESFGMEGLLVVADGRVIDFGVDWQGHPGLPGTTTVLFWRTLAEGAGAGWTGHIQDAKALLVREPGHTSGHT